MDKLTFKLENVSLEQDDYGQHLTVKMVQIYKDGKFMRNAKINADLMELLKNCTLTTKSISAEPRLKLQEIMDRYKCSMDDAIEFLCALANPKDDIDNNGQSLVFREILYLLYIDKKTKIATPLLRKKTRANFDTVEKVKKAYKEEIDKHNASLGNKILLF
jgi:hypothetical protein